MCRFRTKFSFGTLPVETSGEPIVSNGKSFPRRLSDDFIER